MLQLLQGLLLWHAASVAQAQYSEGFDMNAGYTDYTLDGRTDSVLNMDLQCFPEGEQFKSLNLGNRYRTSFLDMQSITRPAPNHFRIEMRGWQSHELVSRMTEILLREKLGFNATVAMFSSGAYIYDRIQAGPEHGGVDLNMETWPGNHECARPLPAARTSPRPPRMC